MSFMSSSLWPQGPVPVSSSSCETQLGRTGEPNGLLHPPAWGLSTALGPLAEGVECAHQSSAPWGSVLTRVGPLSLAEVLGQFQS